MKNYEKEPKKKIEIKRYQKIIIGILLGLFLIATIILMVFFAPYIFSNTTLAIVVLLVLIAIMGVILWFALKESNK